MPVKFTFTACSSSYFTCVYPEQNACDLHISFSECRKSNCRCSTQVFMNALDRPL